MDPDLLLALQAAYATGWLVAAPIGPVNLEIIRRSLTRRLLCGFLVGLGATCVDATYLILFTAGFGVAVRQSEALARGLFLLGGGLLIWLGVAALREAARYVRRGENEVERIRAGAGSRWTGLAESLPVHFVLGLAMTAFNPMTLAFWSSLSLNFVDLPLGRRIAAGGFVWLGALSWVLSLMAILALARRWIGPRLFALVTTAGGCCMVYFGVRFLSRGLLGQ